MIEILSAGQTLEDLIAKADAYFEGGVQSCWIVQPVLETIAVLVPGEKPTIHGTGELNDPATAITVKVRLTARGLLRPRLDTTGTSRISSRIA